MGDISQNLQNVISAEKPDQFNSCQECVHVLHYWPIWLTFIRDGSSWPLSCFDGFILVSKTCKCREIWQQSEKCRKNNIHEI